MPMRPCTTSACSAPSLTSASATTAARSGSATPITWRRTPAGLASGPTRFITDGVPSSRRTAPTCFIAGWKLGANRNTTRASLRTRAAAGASRTMRMPSASSTSAEPQREVNERLPCLGTTAPAPAATSAGAAGVLKVGTVPPPVPQVSTRYGAADSTRTIASRSARAAPATSSAVSPFARNPMSSPPICAGVASPRITIPNTSAVRLSDCDWRLASAASARRSGEGASAIGFAAQKAIPAKRPLSNSDNELHLSPVTSRPFLAVIQYDGGGFARWQRPPKARTDRAEFEAVLERLMGRRTVATGAGRTDAGVHALGQGVGFTGSERWVAQPDDLRRALNALLPREIWVEQVHLMRPGFDGRRSAAARRYRYVDRKSVV